MFRKGDFSKKSTGANPVFEQWINEWKEDAVARDLQSKHTYSKCLNSLRKYPMPLRTGKECIILEGFGDKICKLIDEKLKSFLDDGGILHEEICISSDESIICQELEVEEIVQTKTSFRATKKPIQTVTCSSTEDELVNIEPSSKGESLSLIEKHKSRTFSFATTASTSTSTAKEPGAAKKTRISRKEYMPEVRSGAYALLITLFSNESENGSQEEAAYMLKAELCQQAQAHCNSQFISTDPSNHYTAWSSMSGLVKKLLVTKSNNLPAKFSLTDEGRKLAAKLLHGNTEGSDENTTESGSEEIEQRQKIQKTANCLSPVSEIRVLPIQSKEADLIEICSVDESSDDGIIALDEPPLESSKNDKKSYKYLGSSSSDDELPDIGPVSTSDSYSKIEHEEYINPKASKITTNKKLGKPSVKQVMTKHSYEDAGKLSAQPVHTASYSPNFNMNEFKKSCSIQSQNGASAAPDCVFSLQAGTYDVLLFVDNCEQTAKKQDILIDELKKSKIKFDIGKLHVGDFAWIARPKSANGAATDKDLILNCILERKRMDDFCSSILDGRYKEQKFRLKKCGITKRIYLIEEHGSMKHMSLPEKSLVQADVNTQIIDRLIVHHTTDPKDTAHYLIEMTHFLTAVYQDKTLNVCAKQDLDKFNEEDTVKALALSYCMTLKEFNAFSNKNKPLTMKEMFAKFLMKLQGMSQEKCLAIIEVFPTFESLMKEYSQTPEAKREKLLSNIKYGSQQRNIGPASSKLVAQLFYSSESLI